MLLQEEEGSFYPLAWAGVGPFWFIYRREMVWKTGLSSEQRSFSWKAWKLRCQKTFPIEFEHGAIYKNAEDLAKMGNQILNIYFNLKEKSFMEWN